MANQFLSFCNTDTGSNLLTQGEYVAAADRTVGNQPGTANSKLVNKAARQSAAITSVLAQFMSTYISEDFNDDGDLAELYDQYSRFFSALLPAGMVLPYGGTTEPNGFLFCYGQAISRSTYARLFAAVGTTFGVGDGSTTFNLPDLRGRVVAGRDNMGGGTAGRLTNGGSGVTGTTLGAVGGEQNITLNTSQIPSHTHLQNAHTHTQNSHTHALTDPGHNHNLQTIASGQTGTNPSTVAVLRDPPNLYTELRASISAATGISLASATATNQNTTATNQNTGGDGAHINVQPTMILNYVIKT